ncbi:MAG TPA: bifunctional tetrahydrofolate synthase/dihydrofolate synthase [Burkholderiaceae bacterium]|nr:bifunctional tetrahydrofolate synthase/dihydrofolate synthase [Burkholderiaceae bacterium]
MPSPETPLAPPPSTAGLERWLQHAERLHARPIELGLERVRDVAQRLDIALDCPTFVVAGTNGKGSTCAMLESILRAGGYRTGLYTSPHLVRFNERARIDGREVDDRDLVESLAAVENARAATNLTYFEFTTLAILHRFARAALDAAILEIGLGGRLDAVNIVDADCAIVTSIDLDHVELLGPTREAIALEKAHVYRGGRPAICSDPMAPSTLVDYAHRIGADLRRSGTEFTFSATPTHWNFHGRAVRRAGLPYPALRGSNQLVNAAGVLAALEALAPRLPLGQQDVREGLLRVELAARFQVLPGRPSVVLDVAHNPHAVAVLARDLDRQGYFPRTRAVFGMLRDKDIAGSVARLKGRIDRWCVGPTGGPRGAPAEEVAAIIRSVDGDAADIAIHPTIEAAWGAALEASGPDDRIVVFGSFLTVGEVMRTPVMQARLAPRSA